MSTQTLWFLPMPGVRRLVFTCWLGFCCLSGLAGELHGQVVGVTDGDTITVLDESRTQHKIRLAGIDAPERAQPFGQRAKEYPSSLVFERAVVVETEKQDRYRRIVGKVLIDGRDVNLAMVAAGLAWHYKKYEHEQSKNDRLLYSSAQQDAQASRHGMWSDPSAISPWDWRRKDK